MIVIEQALQLTTKAEVELEIKARENLLENLVGQLYTSIVRDEIYQLQQYCSTIGKRTMINFPERYPDWSLYGPDDCKVGYHGARPVIYIEAVKDGTKRTYATHISESQLDLWERGNRQPIYDLLSDGFKRCNVL